MDRNKSRSDERNRDRDQSEKSDAQLIDPRVPLPSQTDSGQSHGNFAVVLDPRRSHDADATRALDTEIVVAETGLTEADGTCSTSRIFGPPLFSAASFFAFSKSATLTYEIVTGTFFGSP